MSPEQLRQIISEKVRAVNDFPKSGIVFRDVTPLLSDNLLLRLSVDQMVAPWTGKFDAVAGIESRGFIFASAAAYSSGAGLHLLRKPGKLPPPVKSHSYTLEYGQDAIEVVDRSLAGKRVLLLDDVIATGGTAQAAVHLLRSIGAEVVGASFLIKIQDLDGAALLEEGLHVSTHSVLSY